MALPAALNDFMDDLSEDWISQPRSSPPPPSSSPSSQLRSSKRKSILSERSQNHSNIQANSVQRHHGLARRSLSDASSTGSVQGAGNRFDTTARKSVSVSPPKSRTQLSENEPEWRRRLLQGQLGEQKDLFSPMPIENIFQKPGTRGTFRKVDMGESKPKGLSYLKSFAAGEIPSSPPPWPQQMSAPALSNVGKAPSRYGTVNTQQLSALDEEEEEDESRGGDMQHSEEEGSVIQSPPAKAAPRPLQQEKNTRVASNGSVVYNTLPSRKVSFGSVRLEPKSRKASETGSWNLTQGSDDFSPVFISKHNTVDGGIAYAALDLSKSELEARLQHLKQSQASRSRSASASTKCTNGTGDESSLARLESEALPEDLPVGTPDVADVASIGEFVSIKRGGYSEMGSFKRRPLSPSPLRRPVSASADESSMLPQHVPGLDYSGIPPAVPTPPAASAPKTPHTERIGDMLSPQRAKSSNSPLKLFENHDTFTANRLQRRISQLEEPEADSLAEARGSPSRRATGDLSAVDEASYDDRGGRTSPQAKPKGRRQSSIAQHFGQGDFDDFTFEEQQYSSPRSSDAERDLPSRSVSPDMPPPGYQQPFRFHVEEPPSDFIDTFKGRRKPSKGSNSGQLSIAKRSDRTRPGLSVLTDTRVTSQPSQLSQVSEGKRPLTPSPFKSPTPKRRRTVVHHEINPEADEARTTLTHDTHTSFQNALSRKRKDARHGSERNLADPDILAQRDILRPRNPTPSQRRREEAERALREAGQAASSSPRLEAIKEQLALPPLPGESAESVQVRALATHLAVIGEDVAQRKKSVTTQDFLDDAMKVMQFIRTQYRPNSNLSSLNEATDSGVQQEELLAEFPDVPYSLTFDRPPSREGRPRSAWRTGKGEVDPRVVSHLMRFQENEDEAFLTASSRATQMNANEATNQHIETITSDPPGLQILGQSAAVQDRSRTRSDSMPSNRALNSAGTDGTKQSHSSRTSIDSTLARTTTSRKSASENVATLAPDAVAHLIPEQVAGMTYDKDLGRWVKAKSRTSSSTVDAKRKSIANELSGMTGSENDPFGDIPDLTVDSMEETRCLLLSRSAGRKAIGHPPEGVSALLDEFGSRPGSSGEGVEDVRVQVEASEDVSQVYLSPPKKDGAVRARPVGLVSELELPSEQPLAEAESYAHDDEDEGIEHEISILDGRAQPTPPRKQNITVSLSSPAWTRGKSGLSPVLESPAVSVRDYGRSPPKATPNFGTNHSAPAFLHHRQPDNRQLSLSVRVSGTVTTSKTDLAHIQSSPSKSDVTFYLSELPEFTLNQIDERDIPSRALSKHNTVGPVFRGLEDRYADGNQSLVKALQDAAPEEPLWEILRKIVLRGKNLTSLHLLDLLCARLESLDVSRNKLAQLEGAPHGIRSLAAPYNNLTSLTSWGHLFNLQYLDISFNQVDSLQGLAGLVHLRELRANGNPVRSLEGVEGMDGLLRLGLRGCEVESVGFEGCELHRLESLDLGGNGLSNVRGLHFLPALKELKLDGNNLSFFPQESTSCPTLIQLDLSSNALTNLDLTTFAPRLQNLNLDKNRLTTSSGLDHLSNLESLSMRAQSTLCDLTPILTARLPHLHTLSLSHNHIPALTLPRDWYSLRTLELASCGLKDLPEDFGLSVPNLRSLNLNANAIADLRPLLNIKALRELHVAGNRLARLRKTSAVLAKLRALEVLDLRDNPFTLGFHPQAVESRLVSTTNGLPGDEEDAAPTVLQDEEEQMQFLLPSCDQDVDAQYYARLDEGTRLRRRVCEMLLANECRSLRQLDGLEFSRENVLVRDEVWERLVLLGVVRKSRGDKEVDGEEN